MYQAYVETSNGRVNVFFEGDLVAIESPEDEKKFSIEAYKYNVNKIGGEFWLDVLPWDMDTFSAEYKLLDIKEIPTPAIEMRGNKLYVCRESMHKVIENCAEGR